MSGSVAAPESEHVDLSPYCDPNDLTAVVTELRRVNASISRLEQLKEALNARSVEMFVAIDDTTLTVADPETGDKLIAQLRNPEETLVDLNKLRDLLGQSAVDAICGPPKVSTPKWKHAVETGLIGYDVAAEVASFRPKKSYVTFVNAS